MDNKEDNYTVNRIWEYRKKSMFKPVGQYWKYKTITGERKPSLPISRQILGQMKTLVKQFNQGLTNVMWKSEVMSLDIPVALVIEI